MNKIEELLERVDFIDKFVISVERLVNGLDKTNWSSWQTTAYFYDEYEEVKKLLKEFK